MKKFVLRSLLLLVVASQAQASHMSDLNVELIKNRHQSPWTISELDHVLKLYRQAAHEVDKNPTKKNVAKFLRSTVTISRYDRSDYLADTLFPVYKKHTKAFESVLKTLNAREQTTIHQVIKVAQKVEHHGNG